MRALYITPDGRSSTVAKKTSLAEYPEGEIDTAETNDIVADPANTESGLYEVQARVAALGRRCLPVQGDISAAADRARLVDAALAEFGGIDVLVNNAGYGAYGSVEETPLAAARHKFEVNLFGLADLTQPRVQFVNRQRGAGTRVLLDYHLNLMTIVPERIVGYSQEEYTHLGVAAAIASGRADCGLGIAAAAQALDLDFIPLFQERYDLVTPKGFVESDLLAPLFRLLADRRFREAVSQRIGYDVSVMGTMILED